MKGPFSIVLIVASGLVGVSWVGAQDPSQARKPETPSLFPSGYLDHPGLTDALRRLATAHPETVRVESLAKSREGRDVWLATIGPAAKSSSPRPSILVVANLEADHLVGSQVALGLIERLATENLKDREVHVVPRLNPDGAERVLKGVPRLDLRANLAAIDRDRDGQQNEDGPNDLDGDGMALTMRFKGEKATLLPDAKDPRLLRRADKSKGEKPVYSESTEGIDDDEDGAIDEDPPGGVNLNRNWPQKWSEYTPEAGAYPASEPEVHGLIRFAFAHPEIAAVWSFGLNENLRGDPQGLPADNPYLAEIIKVFASTSTRKAELSKEGPRSEVAKEEPTKKAEPSPNPPAEAPRPKAQLKGQGGRRSSTSAAPTPASAPAPGLDGTTDGALSEWAYHQFGVVGLASRLWSRPDGPNLSGDGDARWLDWNDKVMGGSAFVPFHPVEHPTLGVVEVGGWKPGVRLNPPIEQIGAIVEGNLAFLKDLLGKLPRLEITSAKAEAKGGGVFEIKVTVENPGFLPTALAQGVVTRKAAPVLVKLELDEAKLLGGKALERIDALAGSGGSREFRWLVLMPERKKSIKLDVTCPKAGSASREIMLP